MLAVALLAAALCPGCVWFVRVPPLEPLPVRRIVLSEVKYTPQETDWDCGPACLTTVMRHHGSALTLPDVERSLKRSANGGTIVPELMFFARKNGFAVSYFEGSINDLRRRVLGGKPLILFLHPAPDIVRYIGRQGHYVVAVGFDDDEREVILHTGDRAFDTMSYRELQLEWSRTRFAAILVEPK